MRLINTVGRNAVAALLCLSLIVWAITPVPTHTPTILETIQDHIEMIAEHGHAHGFEEDLFWAIHGHGHDAADHAHDHGFLALGGLAASLDITGEAWRMGASPGDPGHTFRIERPPRA